MVKWESAESRAVFLVDPRWLHLSSSKWTTSSTLCAERKKHTYSSEIHWCYQAHNTYWSGCLTRKEDWRLSECRFEQAFVRLLGGGSTKFTLLKEKDPKGFLLSGRKDWNRFKRLPIRIEKNKNGQKKNRSSTLLEGCEGFTSSIWMTKNIQKFSKM